MESAIDLDFIAYICELLSIPNRNLIRQLLIFNCVSCSEMELNLKKLFCRLYLTPIEYSSFSYILNSSVTSYLRCVVSKSLRSSASKHYLLHYPFNTTHNLTEKIMNGLYDCFLHNFCYRSSIPINIEPMTFEIPVKMHDTNSKIVGAIESEEIDNEKQNVSADIDFKSFLLPLEQDYTKSSKGYRCHADMVKHENKCNVFNEENDLLIRNSAHIDEINKECDVENSLIQKMEFSQHSNIMTSGSESDKEIFGDDYRQISNRKSCVGNSHRTIALNYSLKLFADRIKQQLYCMTKNDSYDGSDSDDSVIFSENSVEKMHLKQVSSINDSKQLNKSVNYSDDSDSDDSIVFLEQSVNKKHLQLERFIDNKSNLKNMHNNFINHNSESCSDDSIVFPGYFDDAQISAERDIKKFVDKFSFTSSDSDDEYNCWDGDFDESTSDSFEVFDSSCKINDISDISSCSQNEMINYRKPLRISGYVNICFEDDDELFEFNHITIVNNNWNKTMENVSSEPRQAKKVSFVPVPDLVSVHMFEPDNDGYCYSLYVLDQVRFQNRIKDFESIITPYLTSDHRAKLYSKIYQV